MGKDAEPEALVVGIREEVQPVIFEEINVELVQRIARGMRGSGGPTLIDSDVWKHILLSKAYGNASSQLCQAIADMTKRLSIESINPACLKEFTACRLVPLDKNPGVRPVGIGEVLRRISGKLVVRTLKLDIQQSGGLIQTCTGLDSGLEATIHSATEAFENGEAILLVDADNAFNNLNRKVTISNMQYQCPAFYQYLTNTYQESARLFINNARGERVLSEEGCMQGDTCAMAMYALGTRKLIDKLADEIDDTTIQTWYADDSGAVGEMVKLRRWWDALNENGPKYGYFPKATKTVLVVKDDDKILMKAQEIFAGTGIKIITEGKRMLGSFIGREDGKQEYVQRKVKDWIEDIKELSEIALEEPQIALSAYVKGLCHRWKFIQRTISGISLLFQPLEDAIRKDFFPSIVV